MMELLASQALMIDRPKGSIHPRYEDMIYPFDYGYLADTTSGDGIGIDRRVAWIVNHDERRRKR